MDFISRRGLMTEIARTLAVACSVIVTSLLCLWLTTSTAAQQTEPDDSLPLIEKWQGDFDGMAKRREIRALVVYSKTFYFLDQGRQRGATYELLKEFEKFVNTKLKTKTLKVRVLFIPVLRDQLMPWLVEGRGDIAAANLTITPQRQKQVDFSDPLISDIKELLVTGPAAPPIKSLDDLAGKEIYVRLSSSYYESLMNLNQSFQKAGKKKIKLVAADEIFQDEDLLEMVNAGLIPMIIMDSHKAQFWKQIFDKIQVHPAIAVRTGGAIAWAFRKSS